MGSCFFCFTAIKVAKRRLQQPACSSEMWGLGTVGRKRLHLKVGGWGVRSRRWWRFRVQALILQILLNHLARQLSSHQFTVCVSLPCYMSGFFVHIVKHFTSTNLSWIQICWKLFSFARIVRIKFLGHCHPTSWWLTKTFSSEKISGNIKRTRKKN